MGIGDKWVETNKGLRVRFFIEYVQDHVKMDQICIQNQAVVKFEAQNVLTLKDKNSLRNTFEPY